ncbi:hypothetical protein [Dyella lutea]|uniref:Mor transcription activator domain-containing protein n=1 Tax=Dyella lutea TaxID=2950441 RepID=A0ABT1FEZ2_9GAMM|nr:hypothetical protein [Dyella lutea]MCP1375926.1 hypothetical protein [Dyella lutea]
MMGAEEDDQAITVGHPAIQQGLERMRMSYLLPHENDPAPLDTARRFWAEVIRVLAEGQVLHPDLAPHAAQCLQKCLDEPRRAAVWLGLARDVGAPEKVEDRTEIGRRVQYYVDKGLPRNSAPDDGEAQDAIQAVAKEWGLSRSTIIRAERAYRRSGAGPVFRDAVPEPPKRPKPARKGGSEDKK